MEIDYQKIKIKVRHKYINYETLWLKLLSNTTGRIANIPIYTKKFKYDDVVEFDPKTMEVKRLIFDGGYTQTKFAKYEGNPETAIKELGDKGYIVELWQGHLAVARAKQG